MSVRQEGGGRAGVGGVPISPSAMQCLIALLVVISYTTAGGWDTVSSSVVLSSCSLICQDSDNGCVTPRPVHTFVPQAATCQVFI